MKKLKESKTEIIKRSQINLNPYNPKNHSEEQIRFQKRNLQRVGYLGGIVWNSRSGNLIDGHRRVKAMDLYYDYDGTPEKDYDVKVEVVDYDEKTELEQLTYMATGDTDPDFNLVAKYSDRIDMKETGLSKEDIAKLDAIAQAEVKAMDVSIASLDDIIAPAEKPKDTPSLTAEQIKTKKKLGDGAAYERQQDEQAYATISFSTFEGFVGFCEMFGYDPYKTKFIKGEELMQKLNE